VLAAVEPLLPALEPSDILSDIAELREVHEVDEDSEEDDEDLDEDSDEDLEEAEEDDEEEDEEEDDEELETTDIEVPDAEEVRDGMARVVNRLLADA
jgi:hypothetical protein